MEECVETGIIGDEHWEGFPLLFKKNKTDLESKKECQLQEKKLTEKNDCPNLIKEANKQDAV